MAQEEIIHNDYKISMISDSEEIPGLDTELSMKILIEAMERMAGAPREKYGERQPGERCMYEIQRREFYNQALQASRMGRTVS